VNETSVGSTGGSEGRGHPRRSSSEQSPLQARAAFLKNRNWESVIRFNRGACERGGAQHGQNSEGYEATRIAWEREQNKVLSLIECFDFLRSCHRQAPFLFFNGNTFADVARNISDYLFADLPVIRRRELISAVAHYVAGILDENSMKTVVESLWQTASLQPGDAVQTLRGSTSGVIVKILEDGRVVWVPRGTDAELISLPESLRKVSAV